MSSNQGRTSDYYRTKNIPERFDNPDDKETEINGQVCYIAGNPVFSCVNPPPLMKIGDYFETTNNNNNRNDEIVKGYSEKFVNPIYRTTSMDYGMNKPNVHTMPTVYYAKSAAFTGIFKHLGKTGMYRNQGLNTGISRSKV